MDKLGPETKRYVSPEVFYSMMRQREDEVISSFSGRPREALLDVLEGRPWDMHGENVIEKRLSANITAIRELSVDEQNMILGALEKMRYISKRTIDYMTAKQPWFIRMRRVLAGEPKNERAYNFDPNPAQNFSLVFMRTEAILKAFGRGRRNDLG